MYAMNYVKYSVQLFPQLITFFVIFNLVLAYPSRGKYEYEEQVFLDIFMYLTVTL